MDLAYEQQSYDPEWIQCGDCRKWRKRASEYITAVQAGPWTCDKPGSGCSCQDSCDGCNRAACECPESDTWEDADDPGKHFVAFGAQTPTDFQHESAFWLPLLQQVKRQRELQPQQHVSSSSSPDSLDVMFEMVNCTLGDKAISQEQMRLVQGAVDNVDELKGLKREQLSYVLESIGKMETFQMIMIRHYLTGLQSAATS
ncbi:hypothetical protein WJX82_006576 [Trebouxia sp. C0006]